MHHSIHELTTAATVDSVTGLSTGGDLEDRLQAEIQRARRQQQNLALMMVDIDDFKRITIPSDISPGTEKLRGTSLNSCAGECADLTIVPASAARSSPFSCRVPRPTWQCRQQTRTPADRGTLGARRCPHHRERGSGDVW